MGSDLDVLVGEYMREKGFEVTLEAFKEECRRKGISLSDLTKSLEGKDTHSCGGKVDELIVAFECGEHDAFFHTWSEVVPAHLFQNDPTCQDLDFSLAVYFALYPLKHKMGNIQAAMGNFREYLDRKGAIVSQMQGFTVYCALPYIPDPSTHPSFKHLFTESWTAELHSRLREFLKSICVHSSKPRSLKEIYHRFSSHDENEAELLRLRLQEIQSNYHALAEVAIELVEALEASVSGKTLNPEYIQQMCVRLFEASAEPPPPSQAPPTDLERPRSALQESVESLRQSITFPLGNEMVKKYTPLDYPRLKHDILHLPKDRKVMLLKALRWRLTRSHPGTLRDTTINSYITCDILGVKNGTTPSESLLSLTNSPDPFVKEQFCRLLNSLSSLKVGRDYLQTCSTLSHTLCMLLTSLHEESPVLKNVLGTVQKLSLRRPLQSSMIEKGLLEWVVNLLSDTEGLSDYTLRYSLALLMNLCLGQEGKLRCITLSPRPLHVLSELLEHENNEVRSYVNGILYSLLGVPELRTAAIKMDMLELLQSAMRVSPPELQSQLKYIITRLEEPFINDNLALLSDDDADEDEEDDPEVVDGEDEVDSAEVSIDGEELLRSYFLEGFNPTSSSVDAMPLMRPVTPQNKSHKTSCVVDNRPATSQDKVTGPLPGKDDSVRPQSSLN